MSTFDLAIPGDGSDGTWEEVKKLLNTIIRRKLCDLRLLKLRKAVFARSCKAILGTGVKSAVKSVVQQANGSAGRLLQLMILVVDQTIDEIAAERQIMIACPRPRTVDVLSQGAAPLDGKESRELDPAESAELKQLQEILMNALNDVPTENGNALLMKMNGASVTDIMASQGVSRSTAHHRIKGARDALLEALNDYRSR